MNDFINFVCFILGIFNVNVVVQADPYVQVKIGKQKLSTRDDYIPNTLNPVFGK